MTKSIIDRKDGSLILNDDFIVDRNSLYSETLASAIKCGFTNPKTDILDYENGYKRIIIKCIELDKLYFSFSICFENEKIHMVSFGFSKSKKEETWDDWSEKAELQKKKEYDKWLRKEVGEYLKFNWGNIGANYDPRSGCSYMHLNYKIEHSR